MRILGIDPAPSKETILFDGSEFLQFKARELKAYIEEESRNHPDILICWDAPLSAAIDKDNFSLTIRKIESFFIDKVKLQRA